MRSNEPASRFFLGKAVPERNCPPSLEPTEKGVPSLGKRDGTLPFLVSAVAEGLWGWAPGRVGDHLCERWSELPDDLTWADLVWLNKAMYLVYMDVVCQKLGLTWVGRYGRSD